MLALSCCVALRWSFIDGQVSSEARRPPILMASSVQANRGRVDDATYARNALTAARDAAR